MNFSIANKVVVVTGGAGLIGKSIVKKLLEMDAIPIVVDANQERMDELQKEIPHLHCFYMDITNKESIIKIIEILHQQHGKIDALINNAYPRNHNYGRKFFEVEYADFCENVSLHLGGYFLTMQQFANYFLEQGHGNIINMSSIYGLVAPRFEIYEDLSMTTPVEYAAIKSAVLQLTKYAAKYLKGHNIRVNAICPGGMWDHQPEQFIAKYQKLCLNKGMLDPQDLLGSIVYLLSDAAAFVNGHTLVVDDGFCL